MAKFEPFMIVNVSGGKAPKVNMRWASAEDVAEELRKLGYEVNSAEEGQSSLVDMAQAKEHLAKAKYWGARAAYWKQMQFNAMPPPVDPPVNTASVDIQKDGVEVSVEEDIWIIKPFEERVQDALVVSRREYLRRFKIPGGGYRVENTAWVRYHDVLFKAFMGNGLGAPWSPSLAARVEDACLKKTDIPKPKSRIEVGSCDHPRAVFKPSRPSRLKTVVYDEVGDWPADVGDAWDKWRENNERINRLRRQKEGLKKLQAGMVGKPQYWEPSGRWK